MGTPDHPVNLARLSMAKTVGRAAREWTRCHDAYGDLSQPQPAVLLSTRRDTLGPLRP